MGHKGCFLFILKARIKSTMWSVYLLLKALNGLSCQRGRKQLRWILSSVNPFKWTKQPQSDDKNHKSHYFFCINLDTVEFFWSIAPKKSLSTESFRCLPSLAVCTWSLYRWYGSSFFPASYIFRWTVPKLSVS